MEQVVPTKSTDKALTFVIEAFNEGSPDLTPKSKAIYKSLTEGKPFNYDDFEAYYTSAAEYLKDSSKMQEFLSSE